MMLKKQCLSPEKVDALARRVYGSLITLTLIVSYDSGEFSPLHIIFMIIGSLFAIAIAEIYVKIMSFILKNKHHPSFAEKGHILKEELHIIMGASIPILLLTLNIFNVITTERAFDLSKIILVGFLFFLGVFLANCVGKSFLQKIFSGISTAFIGLIIIAIKLIFKEYS